MFDLLTAYSLTHWLTFFTAAILLTLAPGPDLAFILAQTSKFGKQVGFKAMYGIWIGALLHVVLATYGLSAILTTSATTFTVAKIIGAAYLVYLGIMSFQQPTKGMLNQNPKQIQPQPFRQGVLVAALNPKTALFFLAFLPQFAVEDAGHMAAQLFLHGILVIGVAVIIEPLIVIASSRLATMLLSSPSASRWIDWALGTFFIGLGAKLAFTEQV